MSALFGHAPTRIELRPEDIAELDQQKLAKKPAHNHSPNQPQSNQSVPHPPIINTNKGTVADRIGYRPGQWSCLSVYLSHLYGWIIVQGNLFTRCWWLSVNQTPIRLPTSFHSICIRSHWYLCTITLHSTTFRDIPSHDISNAVQWQSLIEPTINQTIDACLSHAPISIYSSKHYSPSSCREEVNEFMGSCIQPIIDRTNLSNHQENYRSICHWYNQSVNVTFVTLFNDVVNH